MSSGLIGGPGRPVKWKLRYEFDDRARAAAPQAADAV
jgi:hypothetical protein